MDIETPLLLQILFSVQKGENICTVFCVKNSSENVWTFLQISITL